MTTLASLSPAGRWLVRTAAGLGLALGFAASAVAATPVQKVKSPGGIEAWLIESHEVGLISMRLSFDGGAMSEPADKPGIARIMSYLVNEGAGEMSADELTVRRQRIGVNIGGWSDSTGAGVSFSTPSANKAEAFALLRKVLHEPRFDADAVERARNEYEASLVAEQQAPGSIAGNHLSERFFAGSRLATPTLGTLDSLRRLTAADAADYRKRTFVRSALKVAVAGDITPAELAVELDALFLPLPAAGAARPLLSLQPQSTSAKLMRMQIPQSVVMAGNVAPRLDWRQALAFDIGNQALSGGTTGRLFQAVREKRGLVYAIQAQRYDIDTASVFMAVFGSGSENVGPALEATRTEIARFLAEGPTAEEVALAKEAFLGSFFLGLDTNDKLVAQVLWMLRNDLPITYLDDYAKALETITVADVNAALKLAILPAQTVTVVVGDPPADLELEGVSTASVAK